MDKDKVDPEIKEFLEIEQQKAQLQGQVLLFFAFVSNCNAFVWLSYRSRCHTCYCIYKEI